MSTTGVGGLGPTDFHGPTGRTGHRATFAVIFQQLDPTSTECFQGGQANRGSFSLSPLYQSQTIDLHRQYRLRASTRVSLLRPPLRIVHHLSGSRQHAHNSETVSEDQDLLGPCFKTGRYGVPAGRVPRSCPGAEARRRRRALLNHDRRLTAFLRYGTYQQTWALAAAPNPHRYLFAIGLTPVFSLGRNLPPYWGCIPKQPDSQTAPRGATGVGHDGALTSPGPLRGLGARSSLAEDASPGLTIRTESSRFSSWAVPGFARTLLRESYVRKNFLFAAYCMLKISRVSPDCTWSGPVATIPFLARKPSGQVYVRARKLSQSLRRCEERRGRRFTLFPCEEVDQVARRARNRRGHCFTTVAEELWFTSCEETWSSRYDVRETVGAGLRRARKLGQVATTCEEPSGQVYDVRGKLVKSLRRARNRRGRFTSCEETWSSRYDVRGTIGEGLRRARKLGQVATTCEKPSGQEPSGQVYVVRGNLVKSLRRARNRRDRFTSCEETWSSRYDVRGTVGAGLRRARKVSQVATTIWRGNRRWQGLRVRGNLVKALTTGVEEKTVLGQVATTCEEPSGQVYDVRGNLVKSLRRARNRRGRFTSCEETWSSRYDVRGTVGAGLRRARKLGQVATTCEEPSGQVYVVRGNLVKSLRCARNRQGKFTSYEEPWPGLVYDGPRNLDRFRSRFLGSLVGLQRA
ncbi:hypothetical protein Tco_0360173 [Tanacetum coccineum]